MKVRPCLGVRAGELAAVGRRARREPDRVYAAAREQQLRGDSEGEQERGRGEHLGLDNTYSTYTYSGLRLKYKYLQHINKSFKMTLNIISVQ